MSAAHAKQADADTKWDKETDVLVIGYGGAGACAAIEAHDNGSKVLRKLCKMLDSSQWPLET